jgi:hypothetical protein
MVIAIYFAGTYNYSTQIRANSGTIYNYFGSDPRTGTSFSSRRPTHKR